MNPVLFIGGPMDGAREDLAPDIIVVQRCEQTYRIFNYGLGGRVVAMASMQDFQVIGALIARYPTPAQQSYG